MHIYGHARENDDYSFPDGRSLLNFKKLNVFIGKTSSGKSRLLREICSIQRQDHLLSGKSSAIHQELGRLLADLASDYSKHFQMSKLEKLVESGPGGDFISRLNSLLHDCITTKGDSVVSIGGTRISESHVAHSISESVQKILRDHGVSISIVDGACKIDVYESIGFLKLYIPMLRGIRQVDCKAVDGNNFVAGKSQDDLYKHRTQLDYWRKSSAPEIFTGLELYEVLKRMLLGSREQRETVRSFEKFLGEHFFNGDSVTLVPDYKHDHIVVNFGNGQERPIHDLGDGVQSIILSTFSAFLHRSKDLILFIEEPELTLHPGLQRVLIDTLLSKFVNLQIFVTTHSNHFLDIVYDYPNDVQIYSFRRDDYEDRFYVDDRTDGREILDLLGVRNSSVFLSNCVIWTEGVTDRMLLRKLLELKSDFDFKEDYHYSFSEYGGGNLANFDFLSDNEESRSVNVKAISKRNYIVMDNDKSGAGTKKTKRRNLIKRIMGESKTFDAHIEIENLIPFGIWSLVIDRLVAGERKRIRKRDLAGDSAQRFNRGLQKHKIGKLLRDHLIEVKPGFEAPEYFEKDGVACLGADKSKIMQLVVEVINQGDYQLDSFPEVTGNLVESISNFVRRENSSDSFSVDGSVD